MVKMFQVTIEGDPDQYYISHLLHNGEFLAKFDKEAGKIDLGVLKPFVGEKLELYRDGSLHSLHVITQVEPDEGTDGFCVELDDDVGGEG